MKALYDILPIWHIEEGVILSKLGDVTVGYKVELPEIFTLSAAQFEAFHQTWVRAVKTLPAGSLLCKQDWFVETKYQPAFSPEDSFLARASQRFFHERPYLDHQCLLFLTCRPGSRRASSSAASMLLRNHLVPSELMDDEFVHSFAGVCGQFEKILTDSGLVAMEKLDDQALARAVRSYVGLGDDSVVRDISFENSIQIGEKHCALFTLADPQALPTFCSAKTDYDRYSKDHTTFPIGFASALGKLLPCNHLYSQYLFVDDPGTTVKKLEKRKLRLQSLSAYSRENSLSRDAVNDFLNELVSSQQQPLHCHFNVLTWCDSKEQVQEMRNQCISAFAKLDMKPRIETIGAPQLFWAGIPGNAGDFPMNEAFTCLSPQACCFLNLESSYRSSVSPTGVRLGDRISGQPLHIDLSDEPMENGLITNRNKMIIGPSGSGKSFFTNHYLRSGFETGAHIVVVDMGNSYQGLCEMVGGHYFRYSEQQPIRFNPFHLGPGEHLDTEKKESIKALLIALWKKEDESFNRSEYVALSNALQQYYETDVAERGFNSFYEFLQTRFVETLRSQQVKEREFDLSNFLYVLRPYYKGGEFDYLLNAETTLDIFQQRFIVFEIDNIKDHPILFPVVTIIIMELFISKMRKLPGIRKIILIEEAWKAIAREGMADYIKYLFKTVRKYFGEAIVVTQEIEDILSSEIVKQSIVNNADCKILMDQSKYQNKFGEVQQLLGLTEKEKGLVLSINKANEPGRRYKEVFISLGSIVSKVYRVEVSPEEYYTYTTEEKEKIRVAGAVRNYGGVETAIKSLVYCWLLCLGVCISSVSPAQVPIVGLIAAKAIKAFDLKIQKLQNQTLWLQQAQKLIENKLHQLKLQEISQWTKKQQDLYKAYYEELSQVKTAIRKLHN